MDNNHDIPRGYEAIKALAKETKQPIPELLAMHRTKDPFFVGSPTQHKQGEWFAELWQKLNLSQGIHLRRIHYRLLSITGLKHHDGVPYENTDLSWAKLLDASKMARYLALVAPDAFEDHRNPPPRRLTSLVRPDDTPYWSGPYLPEWELPAIDTDLAETLDLDMPAPYVYGYEYAESAQPYLLETWVEKSTVDDVLLPVCNDLGITLVTSVGFQSISSIITLLQQRVALSGKPARIFYISDFDPAWTSPGLMDTCVLGDDTPEREESRHAEEPAALPGCLP